MTRSTIVDVLLICAMKDEYDQVLNVSDGLVDGWQDHLGPEGWLMKAGRFATASGLPLHILVSHAAYMGRESTLTLASKLLEHYPARCLAMSGVCAGRRGKVELGDVIFGERLWSYDAGKTTVEDGITKFQGDLLPYRPSQAWVQRMQALTVDPGSPWLVDRPALSLEYQENWVLLRLNANSNPTQHPDFSHECPDWTTVIERLWQRQWVEASTLKLTQTGQQQANDLALRFPNGLPENKGFSVQVAPLASGADVREDAGLFPRLADSMRKVLGIDMEASAIGALAESRGIPPLVAKGVQDYGDTFKDDRYRNFAARASAECLIALLRENADLLRGRELDMPTASIPAIPAGAPSLPLALIDELAELYPSVAEARALWQRAGGKGREVEDNPRPRDLWQRLWQRSVQGASARPVALLDAALDDHPHNTKLQAYRAALP